MDKGRLDVVRIRMTLIGTGNLDERDMFEWCGAIRERLGERENIDRYTAEWPQ